MASITITLPFSQSELQLLNQTLQKITKQNINQWLVTNLTRLFNEQFTDFYNPFVKSWKIARPTIKYFENRNKQLTKSTFTLNFTEIDQVVLNHIIEIIYDHGMNFWNLDCLTIFLLTQLLTGSREHFNIPITKDYQMPFTRVHNEIIQYIINQENEDN